MLYVIFSTLAAGYVGGRIHAAHQQIKRMQERRRMRQWENEQRRVEISDAFRPGG